MLRPGIKEHIEARKRELASQKEGQEDEQMKKHMEEEKAAEASRQNESAFLLH